MTERGATCTANRQPPPSGDLPVTAWLRATFSQMLHYEPCGAPATHWAYGGTKPLCDRHAEDLRAALRNPTTLGNVLSGGRARTEEEIALMVIAK